MKAQRLHSQPAQQRAGVRGVIADRAKMHPLAINFKLNLLRKLVGESHVSSWDVETHTDGDTIGPQHRAGPCAFPLPAKSPSTKHSPPPTESCPSYSAYAVAYNMDYLVTWNCRHIANGHVIQRLAKVNQEIGSPTPVIVTPEELLSQPFTEDA